MFYVSEITPYTQFTLFPNLAQLRKLSLHTCVSADFSVYFVYMADDDDKPRHKGKVIPTRVPDDVADAAHQRAQREGRTLGEVIRSWLFGWSEGEYPSPPKRGDGRAPQKPETKPRKPRKRKTDDY